MRLSKRRRLPAHWSCNGTPSRKASDGLDRNQDDRYAERIGITDDSSGQPRFDPRAFARLIIFLLVTGGHFLVMAMVLRRHTAAWGLTSLDDRLFCDHRGMSFGTLLAILHSLAATTGISFASGVALIVSLDIILLWSVRGSSGAQRSSPLTAMLTFLTSLSRSRSSPFLVSLS